MSVPPATAGGSDLDALPEQAHPIANSYQEPLVMSSSSMNCLERSFSKSSELTTRAIAGETLVVPITGRVGDLDSIYTLNEVGSRIWQLINDQIKVRQIVESVSDEFDVSRAEAERDVIELINSLAEAGLIRAVESEG